MSDNKIMNDQKNKPCIVSIATASPPYSLNQAQARDFMLRNYGKILSPRNREVMEKVFAHPGIGKRNFTFENPDMLVDEGPDGRINRFQEWAVDLSAQAASKALECAGCGVDDVDGIVVNTCTGYLCPGVSTYLIEKMGLSRRVKAYDLVGSGCGGAIPNLELAGGLLNGNGKGVVLSVSVEICTATFQMEDDLNLIISNAIFGDGAAAAVVRKGTQGIEMVDSTSLYAPEHREAVRYVYKNGQLHNRIAQRLPKIVKDSVGILINGLLSRNSLKIGDISHWAMHASGDKIIDAIQDELGLAEELLKPTRKTLYNHGNMSSATVWFVMEEIMNNGTRKGDWFVAIAFGAGFSAHAFLLRKN
ncbi:MAG: type III polyketide synthase [Nitrospinae bacterium]|nr:type III polyketide synthase [Nitrospinota bacterium]